MPDSTITHVEMDDVLSSIRRLVSEEGTGRPKPVVMTKDRFILTPALRVNNDTSDLPDNVEQKVDLTTQPKGSKELTDVLSATIAATGTTQYDDKSNSQPSAEFEAMEKAWKAELARVADTKPDDITSNKPELDDSKPSLELRIAELEDAVGRTEGEWEPDGSEPEAGHKPKRHIFEVVDNTRDQEPDESEEDLDHVTPVFIHSTEPRPKPYLLSDSTSENPSDKKSTADDSNKTVKKSTSDQSEIVEDDDLFLDVEALRKMVSDVVREELRGKLGESITKNVRRMMQQEIAQAITLYIAEDGSDY